MILGIYKSLKSNYSRPINLGNDSEYKINELIKIIKKINPSTTKIKYFDLPENDPKIRRPDISLAKNFRT